MWSAFLNMTTPCWFPEMIFRSPASSALMAVGTDHVECRAGVERNAVDVRQRVLAGGIGADVIPRDYIVARPDTDDLDAHICVARDDIPLVAVVDAVAVGADAVVLCPALDVHRPETVGDGLRPGSVGADVIPPDHIVIRPAARDAGAARQAPRDDVALASVIDALPVGADEVRLGPSADEDAGLPSPSLSSPEMSVPM